MTHKSLEALVDRVGLHGVLDMLAAICHDKAEHVYTNWSNLPLARAWIRSGTLVAELAVRDAVYIHPLHGGRGMDIRHAPRAE